MQSTGIVAGPARRSNARGGEYVGETRLADEEYKGQSIYQSHVEDYIPNFSHSGQGPFLQKELPADC